MKRTMKMGIPLLMILANAGLILATPARAQQGNPPPASDNSKANRGDANTGSTTADQQKMNSRRPNNDPNHSFGDYEGQVAFYVRPQYQGHYARRQSNVERTRPLGRRESKCGRESRGDCRC